MAMSTQILHEAGRLMAKELLVDTIQILDVGDPVTVGIHVTRSLTPVGTPIPGLVQTISLESPIDGTVTQAYSVKVLRGTALQPGQAVQVLDTYSDLDLIEDVILIDTISKNGLAIIRKGIGQDFYVVNQEGKP